MKLGIYRHYKGNLYQVMGLSRHSETLDEMVVYQALYGDYGLWVRPKEMFLEEIATDSGPQARFTYLHPSHESAPKID